MSAFDPSDRIPSEISFTGFSTLRLLVGVGVTCAGLWAVIAITVGG